MGKIYASANPEMSEREKRNMEKLRKLASQGMVLLKNDGTLPITQEHKKLALYGVGARKTVKGGTGSGDVNSRYVIHVEQGLENAGFQITTKSCWMHMTGWKKKHMKNGEEKGLRISVTEYPL